ncbi:hypothetical protein HQQ94_11865 [Shewanella sp. VB17]|uniref:hypothetical protein n=1 Tax=Shewanella sp. VB17 TaxID=2739432 RepID=UPI001566F965|nr:hypothetical protein [Shewanella sp. VB17]NRD73918.1 hypothetical protein [Shewanella sp. VB17]
MNSNNTKGLTANVSDVQDEVLTFSINGAFGRVTTCRSYHCNRVNLFFLLFAVMTHLIIIIILEQTWEINPLTLPESKQPKLNAYMYYDVKVETIEANIEAVKQKEDLFVPKFVDETHSAAKTVSKPPLKKSAVKESFKVKSKEKASVTATKVVDTNSTSQIKTQSSRSLRQSTQGYVQRQRELALDKVVIEESVRYTRKRSMSEMDGDFILLDLPEHNMWVDAETLDNELDPNRIVKKGHTCYRVVKTPTPLNPYAENLGYPFRCDGKSLASELKKSIAERADRMGIKHNY